MVLFRMGIYHIIISLYGMVWYGYLSYNYLPLWHGMCIYHIITPFMVWFGMGIYHIIISLYGMV